MTGWSLQQAVYEALVNDAALTSLLGGARIYDDVAQGTSFPYVTIGVARANDWSTGTENGLEHHITLHAWSRYAGKKQAFALLEAIRSALHDAPLALTDGVLVNLRSQSMEVRRDEDGKTYHGLIRFRAVTEPIP